MSNIDTERIYAEFNQLLKQSADFLRNETPPLLGEANQKSLSTATKNIRYIQEFIQIIPQQEIKKHIQWIKSWITQLEQGKSFTLESINLLHGYCLYISNIVDDIKKTIAGNSDDTFIHQIGLILKEKIPAIENEYHATTELLQDIINTNKQQINSLIKESQEAIEKTAEYNKLKTAQTFNLQNNILSEQFENTRKNYQKERKRYLQFGIGLSIILGVTYLLFFYSQFTPNSPINYHNHLMLIAVCSPIILLTIWIFYQAGRLTRLIDTYTHKANLGYTLKNTIDYLKDTDTSANKEATLATLQALIKSLHESPIKQEKNSRVVQQNLSQITTLLKEIKDLSPSPK